MTRLNLGLRFHKPFETFFFQTDIPASLVPKSDVKNIARTSSSFWKPLLQGLHAGTVTRLFGFGDGKRSSGGT